VQGFGENGEGEDSDDEEEDGEARKAYAKLEANRLAEGCKKVC